MFSLSPSWFSHAYQGARKGRSIVDMCLACACARDCCGSTWHVFQDVLLVCEFLNSLFIMISVKE